MDGLRDIQCKIPGQSGSTYIPDAMHVQAPTNGLVAQMQVAGQRKPISEVSPGSRLAVMRNWQLHYADGSLSSLGESHLINQAGSLQDGMVVEVRPGANANEQVVLRVAPDTLNIDQCCSVVIAIAAYMMLHQLAEKDGSFAPMSPQELEAWLGDTYPDLMDVYRDMRVQGNLELSGNDAFKNLLDYINSFTMIRRVDGIKPTRSNVEEYVTGNDCVGNGEAYVLHVDDKIFIGIKNPSPQQREQYLDALGRAPLFHSCVELSVFSIENARQVYEQYNRLGMVKAGITEQQFVATLILYQLEAATNTLSLSTTNTDIRRLQSDAPFVRIKEGEDGRCFVVTEISYEAYQKAHYKTDVPTTRLSNGTYATMHNPVIYVEPESKQANDMAYADRLPAHNRQQGYANFAEGIRQCVHPSFNKFRLIAIRLLPVEEVKRKKLHEELKRGTTILDDDDHMNQYWFSFGPKHQAKLHEAYRLYLDLNIFAEEVEVYDWGCGQGFASICLLDYLAECETTYKMHAINLIEPSSAAIERAKLILQRYVESHTIQTVTKKLDELEDGDFNGSGHRRKVHLFSNILDIDRLLSPQANPTYPTQLLRR